MDKKLVTARLQREEGLRLKVGFEGADRALLVVDEPPPLGSGTGPTATELLSAAVGSCLTQSLLFCLHRSRAEVEELETEVETTVARNEKGRLRVTGIRVRISPRMAGTSEPRGGGQADGDRRLDRCMGLFEDFCTVAGSLRDGIPVEVSVEEPETARPWWPTTAGARPAGA